MKEMAGLARMPLTNDWIKEVRNRMKQRYMHWLPISVALIKCCEGLQGIRLGRERGGNDRNSAIGSVVCATSIGTGSLLRPSFDSVTTDHTLFEEFATFLQNTQESIIQEIESTIEKDSGTKFSNDAWGNVYNATGGITRVLEGGEAIEKGACSLTIIRNGVLTAERAMNIRSRQSSDSSIQAGDSYCAAALSMVLHSRNPMVPTFRSDVRIFQVGNTKAWFGGGADLTPYYLFEDDIKMFHKLYFDLCSRYDDFDYNELKQACDEYFYLPARSEHRGTGGIFFDDRLVNDQSMRFVKEVAMTWMPSWIPIVQNKNTMEFNHEHKYWQKLRRGRYLEFNLLYDRGVKFGLQAANPRVEGVMVSAPPEIAYAYNHKVEPNSPEEKLVAILKKPIAWVS